MVTCEDLVLVLLHSTNTALNTLVFGNRPRIISWPSMLCNGLVGGQYGARVWLVRILWAVHHRGHLPHAQSPPTPLSHSRPLSPDSRASSSSLPHPLSSPPSHSPSSAFPSSTILQSLLKIKGCWPSTDQAILRRPGQVSAKPYIKVPTPRDDMCIAPFQNLNI